MSEWMNEMKCDTSDCFHTEIVKVRLFMTCYMVLLEGEWGGPCLIASVSFTWWNKKNKA